MNQGGDYSQVINWVLPQKLACGARPLRYHHIYGGTGRDLPAQARPELDTWIESVRREDIVSIIALVSQKELGHYAQLLPHGMTLIDHYEVLGFRIIHLPWCDPFHTGYSNLRSEVANKRPALLEAYDQLPKPVLVHCSAAIDRSPPVVAYVVYEVLKRHNGTGECAESRSQAL